ncbi:MAG TPA: DUF1206 domain-containing protein [Acidimicrobiales bacterium]|nr:DUF1206 domain-containing protein [Acidimicrobiales bacterium]
MTATRAATRVRRGTKTAKSGARHASSRARQVRQKTLVQRTARAGLCARGLIYLVLTVITVDIAAFGGTGKRASATGAIDELVRQPAGPFLVIAWRGVWPPTPLALAPGLGRRRGQQGLRGCRQAVALAALGFGCFSAASGLEAGYRRL